MCGSIALYIFFRRIINSELVLVPSELILYPPAESHSYSSPSPQTGPSSDTQPGPGLDPQGPDPEMASMTIRARLVIILFALAFVSCSDDEKSTGSNQPPDLRKEDVVGCWYWGGRDYCRMKCFDPAMIMAHVSNDSIAQGIYESAGRFWIVGSRIGGKSVAASSFGRRDEDSAIEGSVGYQRVGENLYVLDKENRLADRFEPVNLDPSFPCGKPFSLLPKPTNWTLF